VTDTQALRVDGSRLWSRLMELAEIGATPAGGCNRQALTDEDCAARSLFARWCENAGCDVRLDAMGNLFARRAGATGEASVVLTGSHLDTQPTGGRFDGIYGVLAGLEVIETLNDHDLQTRHPLEVVVWTNEEGYWRNCSGPASWASTRPSPAR
jgi:N-carbamoyl-L-amino-acid hydrolase